MSVCTPKTDICRSSAMKLLVLSGLHVECVAYKPDPAVIAAADVVVLTGDIHIGGALASGRNLSFVVRSS